MSGRNIVRLVQLVPGASEGQTNSLASGTRPDDRRQTSAVSINGSLDNQNNQLIDGIDNNERAIGTVVRQAVDRRDRRSEGPDQHVHRRGRPHRRRRRQHHHQGGQQRLPRSAFEFARNDKFDERNYFATNVDRSRSSTQNQYGGSLGGPMSHNKTFFFADYERLQRHAGRDHGGHRADGEDARRRLLRAARRRSTIRRCRRACRFRATSSRQLALIADRAELHGAVSAADRRRGWRTTTPARATGRRTRRPPTSASITASTRTIGSSFATRTTVSTRSRRRCFRSVNGIEPGGGGSFPGQNHDRRAHDFGASYAEGVQPVAHRRVPRRLLERQHRVATG